MIYLRSPHADKGYMLVWAGENPAEGARFRRIVLERLPRTLRWFFQVNTDEYKAVEFWTDNLEAIMRAAREVAAAMGVDPGLVRLLEDDPPLHELYPSRYAARPL